MEDRAESSICLASNSSGSSCSRQFSRVAVALLWGASVLGGCVVSGFVASGCAPLKKNTTAAASAANRVAPVGNSEAELLTKLDSLPSGTLTRVASLEVLASRSFDAASGRTCRQLQWQDSKAANSAAQTRLACNEGKRWYYVPEVLSSANNLGDLSTRKEAPRQAPAAFAAPQ